MEIGRIQIVFSFNRIGPELVRVVAVTGDEEELKEAVRLLAISLGDNPDP
jgi:hypothetical protein